MITQIENVILIVVLIFQIFCFGVRLIETFSFDTKTKLLKGKNVLTW